MILKLQVFPTLVLVQLLLLLLHVRRATDAVTHPISAYPFPLPFPHPFACIKNILFHAMTRMSRLLYPRAQNDYEEIHFQKNHIILKLTALNPVEDLRGLRIGVNEILTLFE